MKLFNFNLQGAQDVPYEEWGISSIKATPPPTWPGTSQAQMCIRNYNHLHLATD